MRRWLGRLGVLACVFTGLSFLGHVHPFFDSLAVFRPYFWLVAWFGLLVVSAPRRFVYFLFIVLMALPFHVLIDRSQNVNAPVLRLYQHNLLFTNTAPDLAMVTERLQPDVLTLQELRNARPTIDALEGYPFRQICSFEAIGDVGLLSKHEFVNSGCTKDEYRGVAWARLQTDKGEEVTIVSVHLYWPFPFEQPAQLASVLPEIAALPAPVILAGDFNQVPWSATIQKFEAATRAKILPGLRFSLIRFPVILPIDHVFANAPYHAKKLARYGSDHNAILVDFAKWPE